MDSFENSHIVTPVPDYSDSLQRNPMYFIISNFNFPRTGLIISLTAVI